MFHVGKISSVSYSLIEQILITGFHFIKNNNKLFPSLQHILYNYYYYLNKDSSAIFQSKLNAIISINK